MRGGQDETIGLMDVLLANPRGFCAGVERAIEIVERALGIAAEICVYTNDHLTVLEL